MAVTPALASLLVISGVCMVLLLTPSLVGTSAFKDDRAAAKMRYELLWQ